MIELIVVWFLFGILAYGQWLGLCYKDFGDVLGVEWNMILWAAFSFLFGPIGLFFCMLNSVFYLGKPWNTPKWIFWKIEPLDDRYRGLL